MGPLRGVLIVSLALAVVAGGCRSAFAPKYEYEEDVHLTLDGSATIYVNASVPALVALRGANLPLDAAARLDRADVRAFFETPVSHVENVTMSRRDGRRYLHVRIEAPDIRALASAPPFAWSTYQLIPQGRLFIYKQTLGTSAARDVGDVGWNGQELVAIRLHLPSRIPFHNQPQHEIQRGNIIAWEQPLTARRAGQPLEIEVHMEQDSILFKTLGLFASMAVMVALTFVVVVWLVRRQGGKQVHV